MSVQQATIPFKLRKRTYVNSEVCDENQDIRVSKTVEPARKDKLKRRLNHNNLTNIKDDDGVRAKISRKNKCVSPVKHEQLDNEENKHILKPLICREKEIEWLESILLKHAETQESISLYISGQPGTGKTACLSYILQLPKIKESYKQVYVNCTTMKSAASIYSRICKELQLQVSGTSEKVCCTAIEKYLTKKHKMILLVLDEIDQLDSARQSVLYTIFEWGARHERHEGGVVVVGVANALDLTERALPRLQARVRLRPRTLHFAPYTKEQIVTIFTDVLANQDKGNLFSPVALQMLAAKIAAVSGDMRRALDIGRRVIEVAKRSKFMDNKSVDCMMKDSSVTVELKEVLQVLNDVYGGSRKIETDVDEAFPLQQKLILCSLMLMLSKGKNKDITMGKLHDVYKKVANTRNIVPLELSEMSGACALLEARGAVCVRARPGGASRAARLRLHWDEAELAAALRDKPLLASILADRC